MIQDWLRRRVTEYTPGVGRVFLVCRECQRVVPYYRVYGPKAHMGCPHCANDTYRIARIPEWKAALWLLWGYVSRQGDPRMPIRQAPTKYA